jgi:hypothetical protein
MRERRTADRGIESRRINAPQCDVLASETLARYLMRTISKDDVGFVDEHLQDCDECWTALVSTYKLFALH